MDMEASASTSKKTKGRQKIEMVKIENEASLQVSFSKRKEGVFKKANEIATLCGVQIAVIVNSPGNKMYAYGNPSPEVVIDRYLGNQESLAFSELLEARRSANVLALNNQLTQMMNGMEDDKKRGTHIGRSLREYRNLHWCTLPLKELSQPQLHQLKLAMEEHRKDVVKEEEKFILFQGTNSQPFYFGSSSNQGAVNDNSIMMGQGLAVPYTNAPNPTYDSNMIGNEYVIPNMIEPSSGHINPNIMNQGYAVGSNAMAAPPPSGIYDPNLMNQGGYAVGSNAMAAPPPSGICDPNLMNQGGYAVGSNAMAAPPPSGICDPNLMNQGDYAVGSNAMAAPPPSGIYNPNLMNQGGYAVGSNVMAAAPQSGYDPNTMNQGGYAVGSNVMVAAPQSGYNPSTMNQGDYAVGDVMVAAPPLGYDPNRTTNEGYGVVPNSVTATPGYGANPQDYSIQGSS